jgi:hypothetical protein
MISLRMVVARGGVKVGDGEVGVKDTVFLGEVM